MRFAGVSVARNREKLRLRRYIFSPSFIGGSSVEIGREKAGEGQRVVDVMPGARDKKCALIRTSSPTYPATSAATARCEMTERATAAQLRYLGRLLAGANTTWTMVQRRWSAAPDRFDRLDKQQAGALIATLRRHGHLPANHSLDGGPPRRQNSDWRCAMARGTSRAVRASVRCQGRWAGRPRRHAECCRSGRSRNKALSRHAPDSADGGFRCSWPARSSPACGAGARPWPC